MLSGAAGAVSATLGIATAATNHNTRHPLVTATMSTTMHRLTGGRFCLGLGRGFDPLFDIMGLPRITSAQMDDVIGILRRLWHGEAIFGHDGPAGQLPAAQPGRLVRRGHPRAHGGARREDPRAGRPASSTASSCTPSSPTRRRPNCVAAVRRGAEQAGRDPASVRVWSRARHRGRPPRPRAAAEEAHRSAVAPTCRATATCWCARNGWDPDVLTRFRADEVVTSVPGAIDAIATTDQLEYLATILPDEWTASAATGTPEQCAATVAAQFDLGVDSVIMHGATPDELAPVVEAYRAVRPAIARLPAGQPGLDGVTARRPARRHRPSRPAHRRVGHRRARRRRHPRRAHGHRRRRWWAPGRWA